MTDKKAIVVQRVDEHAEPNTEEIESLAHSAGYAVCETITQSREEDAEYNIGSGKVHDIQQAILNHGADAVIVDNELGAYQKYNLGIYFPQNVDVFDRYTLILNLFEKRANTRHAQLQIELARLRYELPRADVKKTLAKREERPGFMGLGEYDESREEDIKNRISRIQDELSKVSSDNEHRRYRRRESGFDLVAIAGYTNAGKSTLLRQLADDHTVEENEELHEDLDPTAESSNDLFTTLDTTTRRMDFEKRDVLLTDTVGFISDLPEWLVDSFNSTFDSIYAADLVLLVADATESVETIHEKMVACQDAIHGRLRKDANLLMVFNKIDELDEEEWYEKRAQLSAIAPDAVSVSAKSGTNIDQLKQRMHELLPELKTRRLQIPLCDSGMSLVSWIHENAYVIDEDYTGEYVVIEFEARPAIAGKAQSRLAEVETPTAMAHADD